MLKFIQLTLLIISLCFLECKGYSIEQLKKQLDTTTNDSIKIWTCKMLCVELDDQHQSFMQYVCKGIAICNKHILSNNGNKEEFYSYSRLNFLNIVSHAYLRANKYYERINMLNKNLKEANKIKNLNYQYQLKQVGYRELGVTRRALNQDSLALKYIFQSLVYHLKIPVKNANADSIYKAFLYAELGNIALENNNIELAIGYSRLSLKYITEYSFILESFIDNTIGEAYRKINNTKKAFYYFLLAYNSAKKYNAIQDLPLISYNIAAIYEQKGDVNQASKYYNLSYKEAQNVYDVDVLTDVAKRLTRLYSNQKNITLTKFYFEKYLTVEEEQTKYKKENELVKIEMSHKYEVEKRMNEYQEELKQLKYESDLKQTRAQIYGVIGLALLVIVSIVYVALDRQTRQKLAYQKKLVEQQHKNFIQIIETQESERKRIAADIHDGIGQMLIAAKMNINYLGELETGANQELIKSSSTIIQEIIDEIRNITFNLMPSVLTNHGLEKAILQLVEKLQKFNPSIIFTYEHSGLNQLTNQIIQVNIFRIIQEFFSNALKYAHAKNIKLKIVCMNDTIVLEFNDDGKGFDFETEIKKGQNGLKNIMARVALLKGYIDMKLLKETNGKNYHITLTKEI